jgi:4-amino-4-deoxy-L-arabinose transferase-like glycosyltransferase
MSALNTFDGKRFLIGVILALGALVRLSGLDVGWFLQDQVRDAMAAQGILSGREFPLVGPHAAMGTVYLVGPLYYYLVAIPYGFSTNPVVGVAFLNLLGVLSIYLTYLLGKEMFGAPVGLIAAALYAVFPMAVLSGKALWNPGFIPFFATLFLFTLWRFLVGRCPWILALALFLLGVLLQIHMSGAMFALLLPVALLLYRPPLQQWPLITGLLSIVLLYVPYVIFEVQHGFPDTDKIFAWAGENPSSSFWLIAWRGFWRPFVLPERLAAALGREVSPSPFPLIQHVEGVLVALGLLTLLLLMIKAKDRRPYILLGLWFVLPFLIAPHNKGGGMWYYFDILYPSQFLIIGVLVQIVLRVFHKTSIQRWAYNGCLVTLALLVGFLVALQVWFTISFEGGVQRSGLLKITRGVYLASPDQGEAMMQTMPLRDKKALAKSFLREFGVDHAFGERRIHGAIYQLFREDKGFLFGTMSPRMPVEQPDTTLHYLILQDDFQVTIEQGHETKVGAYRIVAYQPLIQYESWRWSISPKPEWWREKADDSTWAPLILPARKAPELAVYADVPYARWPGKAVTFRGWLTVPSVEQPVWLVLNIRNSYVSRHELGELYLNGQPLKAARTVSYDSVTSRNVEVLVDVTSDLRAGSNLIAFEVTGLNGEFDLDLYELRLALGTGGR